MATMTASDPIVNSDPAEIEPTAPYTDADAAWWAGENIDWHSDEPTPDFDAMAGEAHAQAMLEIGCLL